MARPPGIDIDLVHAQKRVPTAARLCIGAAQRALPTEHDAGRAEVTRDEPEGMGRGARRAGGGVAASCERPGKGG